MQKIQFFTFIICLVVLILLAGCQQTSENNYVTYLDSLEFDHIINPFGPPERGMSFGRKTLTIDNQKYERGLGGHAPAHLNIDLNGKASYFRAKIGIDQEILNRFKYDYPEDDLNFPRYVYDNRIDHYDTLTDGSVVFRVLVDGDQVFESEVMTVKDKPVQVEVNLKGAQTLTLVTDETSDGSFNDHTNWADARIIWTDEPESTPQIYHYPQEILVNHHGFLPKAFKSCYLWGEKRKEFTLRDSETDEIVFTGFMEPAHGDLGRYLTGDFTEFTTPGKYYLSAGDHRSVEFSISDDIFISALRMHLSYLENQRTGHPEKGWAPGNHLDDGIRNDTGEYQDVTGGWYDANDLRKPARGNVLLLFALATLADAGFEQFPPKSLLEEIKWGNKFLFAMQEPEGYLMHYVGATNDTIYENKWTDNVLGTPDDRMILTHPADTDDQMIYALTNAMLYRIYKVSDPEFAQKSLRSAENAWDWVMTNQISEIIDHNYTGIAIAAATELYKATRNQEYRRQAIQFADQLYNLYKEGDEHLSHHFFNVEERNKVLNGRWVMMGVERFTETFGDQQIATLLKDASLLFIQNYYLKNSQLNTFGLVPWVWGLKDMESKRQMGPYYYRYFLHVGMNQHLASTGIAFNEAYKMHEKEEFLSLAQYQIDWLWGANPFNASTFHGIGYNHPSLFKTSANEFKPHTPVLEGGVMTGIGSNRFDKLALFPGFWWTTEYWAPTVTYNMILSVKLKESYKMLE